MKDKKYDLFTRILLKNNEIGTIVDYIGPDYVVDIGKTADEYDTVIVSAEEMERVMASQS